MRRDTMVVLVVVAVAALVLAAGLYLLVIQVRSTLPSTGPVSVGSVPVWTARLDPGLTYSEPVIGPTTPLNDVSGGLWVLNAAREGVIDMNLTQMQLGLYEDPFAVAGRSLRLNLATDFAEPGFPLGSVYYIVPARDFAINGTLGPPTMNGAIAFFAGSDFVAADPFNRTVFFRYHLPFSPTWTGEDPASAGDMLVVPVQMAVSVGAVSFPVGPYRYFWASDGSHTVVFEVTYVHAGYCPCAPPSGQVLLFANATLSAPPLVYYNEFAVSASSAYRSGAGADIVLPLANGTLEIFDTEPALRAWVPLTLGGQPATVVGPIGFVQSSYPARLLLSLRSASGAGLAALDLATLSEVFTYPVDGASLEPIGPPLSRTGAEVYTAWYSPGDNDTRFVGVNGTGVSIPQFYATIPGRAASVFQVFETYQVFVEGPTGRVVTLATTYGSTTAVNDTPTAFPVSVPPGVVALYGGSPGGTRYGTLLSGREMRGAWTNPANTTTALFRLVPVYTLVTSSAVAFSGAVPSMGFGSVVLLAAAVDGVRAGRRRSCSATACGPRPSCPRTRA